MDLVYKAITGPTMLSAYETYRFHHFMRAVFQRIEAQYALYANSIIDDEVSQLRRRYVRGLLKFPVVAEVWQVEKANFMFTIAFVHEIDTMADTTESISLGLQQHHRPTQKSHGR